MQGESPLNMMQPRRQRPQRGPRQRRRRRWPVLLPLCVAVVLGIGWCWLWYYAASVADRTLAGWVAREAAAGRVYSCRSQDIAGFPFRITVHCAEAGVTINSNQPPFAISARDITFAAQVYEPTLLVGDVTSPVTVSVPGRTENFIANWSRGRLSVRGLPPEPESVTVALDKPRLDQTAAANQTTVFNADNAEVQSRIVGGSAADHPVIETFIQFKNATAPTVHRLLADPVQGEIDVVVKGFNDLAPKPWSARFRELQQNGGSIEIRRLRLQRPDAIVVGAGTVTVTQDGKPEGLIRVGISGIENIVPLLGVDKLIGQGIDRLAGNSQPQGLGALDRLLPGLSGVVRDTANANIIDDLKKMGQPSEIDKKPAIVLPLRISDGSAYLGMIPLGDLPPLF